LMGLSKQPGSVFDRLLQTVGLEPGKLRGLLRGMVKAVNADWRSIEDVEGLGNKAFPELHEADPSALAAVFVPAGPHRPVMTPRMVAVLRDAAQLAFESAQDTNQANPRVGHVHLLQAALKHQQCLAVNLVLGIMLQAGWSPKEVSAWIQHEISPKAPGMGAPALKPPPAHQEHVNGVESRFRSGPQ
jgi:hypothetical protein